MVLGSRNCVQVKVMVSGLWWDNMTPEQKRKNYEAVAVEYTPEMVFPGLGRNPATKQEAIRFHVLEDVQEDPAHEGMQKPTRSFFSFSCLLTSHLEDVR
jgi:hypothetical protein